MRRIARTDEEGANCLVWPFRIGIALAEKSSEKIQRAIIHGVDERPHYKRAAGREEIQRSFDVVAGIDLPRTRNDGAEYPSAMGIAIWGYASG